MGTAKSKPRKRRSPRKSKRGQREVAKVEQEIAITEQLTDAGLSMESQPWARYAASGGLIRMIALAVRRWKKKRQGLPTSLRLLYDANSRSRLPAGLPYL